MKYIKKLDEGAELIFDDLGIPISVNLNWENTKSEYEYLKTNYIEYGDPGLRSNNHPEIGIYAGLIIDDKLKDKLKSSIKDNVYFKITADLLKDVKIQGGSDSICSFLKKSTRPISQKYGGRIDYVFPMGSTKGLSSEIASCLSSVFPKSNILGLDKRGFNNIVDALNWDYIIEYDYMTDKKPILDKIKALIKAEAEEMSDKLKEDIKSAKSGKELRLILFKANPKYRDYDYEYHVVWKNTPYIIRSSGLSFGGSRKYFKDKYRASDMPSSQHNASDDLDLIEAIRKCIFNDKSILIVDDNISTRMDIYSILDSISKIGNRIIETSPTISDYKTRFSIEQWKKRVNVYALIYFDKIKLATQTEISDFIKHNQKNDDISNNV